MPQSHSDRAVDHARVMSASIVLYHGVFRYSISKFAGCINNISSVFRCQAGSRLRVLWCNVRTTDNDTITSRLVTKNAPNVGGAWLRPNSITLSS